MNVGYMCKYVPAHLPHEVLGLPLDSLPGTLLSIEILGKVAEEESKETSDKTGQSARRRKFKSRK